MDAVLGTAERGEHQDERLLERERETRTKTEDEMSANYTFSMIHIDRSVSSKMTFDEWVAAHIAERNHDATADEYTLVDGVIVFQEDLKLICANEVNPKGRVW